MTLLKCQKIIRDRRERNSACDWEDERDIVVPEDQEIELKIDTELVKATVHYNKGCNILTIT